MAWVPALFLAVTAMALAAWRSGWKPRRVPAEPRYTQADHWLLQHYQLTSLGARLEVREAVRGGRAVEDPALRQAAHGLAGELLSGRLRDPDTATRVIAGLNTLAGLLYLGTGLVHGGRGTAIDIWLGTGWVLSADTWLWGAARLPRRKAARALQLNNSDTDRT